MPLYTDYRQPNSTVTDAAAINNAIRNILLTRKGSVPGKPTFGSDIQQVLFNQMDYVNKNVLKNFIREALEKWEKRVTIVDVVVTEDAAYNRIIATLSYIYRDKGLDINEQLSITLLD